MMGQFWVIAFGNEVCPLDAFEARIQSFVVKIWLEEDAQTDRSARWRGSITHVPSGNRRYFQDLDEIRTTISPYLEAMGVDMTARK
jgi:hypothetical protein